MIADAAGHHATAVQYIRHALGLAPNRADFLNNLGTIHEAAGELDEAADCLRAAVRLRPDYAAAHNNLGEVYRSLGRVSEAMASYRAALTADPNLRPAQSNLLNTLNCDPDATPEAVLAEHRRWGQQQQIATTGHANDPNPDRPLRLGYVSPDFRDHAVARFFERCWRAATARASRPFSTPRRR
jgi:tetratricopeptide (TPR) repeat protein